MLRLRSASASLAVAVLALVAAEATFADLGSRQQALRSAIGRDNRRIAAYNARLGDVGARLAQLESSAQIQRQLLARIQGDLRAERSQVVHLRLRYAVDRQVLANQLLAQYESDPPSVIDVVVQAHGFTDLLDRLNNQRLIANHNAATIRQVAASRRAAVAAADQLARDEVRQRTVTIAVLSERDQADRLRLTLLAHRSANARARARKQAALDAVDRRLARLAAQSGPSGLPPGAGYNGSGFAPHSGDYGFFPAPGTNYSVGQEPALAARLDALGRALRIHLIGISGYRTPQHSVEVGGFANDPHTRGAASDTPGVEGVPESTLRRFGLTRPFPGAAEADHIQLA